MGAIHLARSRVHTAAGVVAFVSMLTASGFLKAEAASGATTSVSPAASCRGISINQYPKSVKKNVETSFRGGTSEDEACRNKTVKLQKFEDRKWSDLNGRGTVQKNGSWEVKLSFTKTGKREIRACIGSSPCSGSVYVTVTER